MELARSPCLSAFVVETKVPDRIFFFFWRENDDDRDKFSQNGCLFIIQPYLGLFPHFMQSVLLRKREKRKKKPNCSSKTREKRIVARGGGGVAGLQSFCYQIDHYKLYLTRSAAGKTNGAVSQRTSPITPRPFRSINSCSSRADLGERDK